MDSELEVEESTPIVLSDFRRRPRSDSIPSGHLDTAEVAEVLGLTPEHTRKLVKTGKLPAKRVRNKYWFSRRAVSSYVTSSAKRPRIVDPLADLNGQEVD